MGKTFVSIIAEHDIDGKIKPLILTWPDQRRFPIDRILDVRRAAAMKAGGAGTRYLCRVLNREVSLFHDDGRWFVET